MAGSFRWNIEAVLRRRVLQAATQPSWRTVLRPLTPAQNVPHPGFPRYIRRVVHRPADPPEVLERFHGAQDLVEIVARQVGRTVGAGFELEELLSFGREGLLEAARRFDASRGVPFRAYAHYRVRGAIIDELRRASRVPRRLYARLRALEAAAGFGEGALEEAHAPEPPGTTAADAERALVEHLAGMATAMALGLVAPAESVRAEGSRQGDSPEEACLRGELRARLQRALGALSEEEAQLVCRYYFGGEQLEQVARDLGLSRSWASRLHTRALTRLARKLRSPGG